VLQGIASWLLATFPNSPLPVTANTEEVLIVWRELQGCDCEGMCFEGGLDLQPFFCVVKTDDCVVDRACPTRGRNQAAVSANCYGRDLITMTVELFSLWPKKMARKVILKRWL
jgi:NAD-dependent dihydropyrimidine dehydrogenase PreA subunit